MDATLSWTDHINNVKARATNITRHLARTANILPQKSKRLLYDSLLCPHLNYADIVWDGCLKRDQVSLQRVHNFAARIVAGSERRAPSSTVLRGLGMMPLTEKRKVHQAVFIHKVLNGRGPQELCNSLQTARQNYTDVARTYNLRSKDSLSIPPKQHRTAKFEKSTVHRSIKVWNSTAPATRQIVETSKFKIEVQREIYRAHFERSS